MKDNRRPASFGHRLCHREMVRLRTSLGRAALVFQNPSLTEYIITNESTREAIPIPNVDACQRNHFHVFSPRSLFSRRRVLSASLSLSFGVPSSSSFSLSVAIAREARKSFSRLKTHAMPMTIDTPRARSAMSNSFCAADVGLSPYLSEETAQTPRTRSRTSGSG